ncbi:MAG: choice-of-anchor U domain-containing protein, partial [Gammaproteobacteria bacterium]
VPANWTLTDASCSSSTGSSIISPIENGQSIELAPADDVICTFINTFDDGDGIVAEEEDGVPGYNGSAQGDGNGDSIADKLQANVSSVQDGPSSCWWTIETDGVQHSNVAIETIPAGVPPGGYPCNFARFEVELGDEQSQLQLTLYFAPRNAGIQGVLKFNHLSGQWETIGTVDHSGDKTIVHYSLSDGGPYDDDQSEDGRIQDPVGAVALPSAIPSLNPVGLGVLVVAWALLLLSVRRRQGRVSSVRIGRQ